MVYQLQENYLIPVVNTKDGNSKNIINLKEDLDNILDEQIMIVQLGKGITFEDTNNMDTYERSYVLNRLIQLKKDENEAKQKAIENMKNR